jgi:hypothetical protein
MISISKLTLIFILLILSACGGADQNEIANGTSYSPAPSSSIRVLPGVRSDYQFTKIDSGYLVHNLYTSSTSVVADGTLIQFDDVTVNLSILKESQKIKAADLNNLLELYVAFFNRVPDAEGLSYWIEQVQNGVSIEKIADSFYQAAIQYSSLTGYSSSMSNAEFVKIIYKNVLGRVGANAPTQADVQYWATSLDNKKVSKGQLVSTMLVAAHSFKGDATWGWVPQLLENKINVAYYFSIELGLTYISTQESINKGMAIAAAITPTSISEAKYIIGIDVNISQGPTIPEGLWKPPVNAIPKSGNYIYLQSDKDDYIGGGTNYLYTNSNAIIDVLNGERMVGSIKGLIGVFINGNQKWRSMFQVMGSIDKLVPGYYKDIEMFPSRNPNKSGLDWSGESRSCDYVNGWFTIDKIELVAGVVTELDLRFEQACDNNVGVLRGSIHWLAKDNIIKDNSPTNPIPSNLWQPLQGMTPSSGNYIYLQSDTDDWIGKGKINTYTNANSTINLTSDFRSLKFTVDSDLMWLGEFTTMNGIFQPQVGYYGNLMRNFVRNPLYGGLDVVGNGSGCNTLNAWVAIDKIEYVNGLLQSIELRFEQHCEGAKPALRGKIHWNREDANVITAVGPIWPIPTTLWKPIAGLTPASGNFIYLQSEENEPIGEGLNYLYTNSNSSIEFDFFTKRIEFELKGKENWSGQFQAMEDIEILKPGYYGELTRYPFHNKVKGGLNVDGKYTGCNTLTGWFVIDKITWELGLVKELEMRFSQKCNEEKGTLHGQIRWHQ